MSNHERTDQVRSHDDRGLRVAYDTPTVEIHSIAVITQGGSPGDGDTDGQAGNFSGG